MSVDDVDDVTAVPVFPMTYGVKPEELEEQAVEKQNKKKNKLRAEN